MIPGETAYRRWKRGIALSQQEAINAFCYICREREDSPCTDAARCVLHEHSPFRQAADKKAEDIIP